MEAISLTGYDKSSPWYVVMKDGKKLAYGKDAKTARRQAEYLGAEVWCRGVKIEPKLNDHFPPYYARLIMEREPDLAGFFEIRGAA